MHLVADRFEFDEARKRRVFVCARVRDGAPVLWVSHDENGDWQFLCGGDHVDPSQADKALLWCLECAVARDPSLNETAHLAPGEAATRTELSGSWEVFEAHSDPDDGG